MTKYKLLLSEQWTNSEQWIRPLMEAFDLGNLQSEETTRVQEELYLF